MAHKIFISRELEADSLFFELLPSEKYTLYHESLIDFSPMSFDSIPACDWVFFYSRKGVQFALQIESFKNFIQEKKIAAMGEATATSLQFLNIKTNFIGNGNPEQTANDFLHQAKGQRILFPQAQHSRQSIQRILGDKIEAHSLIVYQNKMRQNFNIPYCDYLVFTSPLNAQAYCQKYEVKTRQKIFAIGETTAAALVDLGIEKVIVANQASEKALAQAILEV